MSPASAALLAVECLCVTIATHITFTYTDYTGFRVPFVVCRNERSVFSEQTSFHVVESLIFSAHVYVQFGNEEVLLVVWCMNVGSCNYWDTVMDIVYGACQARRLYSVW